MKALSVFGRSRQAVTYEVRLDVEPAIVEDFDEWLRDHVREMLAFPGFQAATVYRASEVDDNGRVTRVAVYRVRSQRELDSYLHTHAPRMREEGVRRFGKRFTASRRILPSTDFALPEGLAVLYNEHDISGGLPVCGNCLAPVPGRYCVSCGQEDRTFMLSLGELVYDFVGDLFNFDSRFFRTLRPLLVKPGLLTTEFVRGRRQRYLPPVRMYIFVSLIFFFLAALVTDVQFGDAVSADIGDGQEMVTVEGLEKLTPQQRAEIAARMRNAEEQIGIPAGTLVLPGAEPQASSDNDEQDAGTDNVSGASDNGNFNLSTGPGKITFRNGEVDASGFGSEEIDARLERGARALQRNPKAFAQAVLQQIPSMMFFFLPLIALALKLFYIGTGRYYVEHLIFTLHFHSAVFVLLLLWLLFGEAQERWRVLEPLSGWITTALWIYLPFYLYRSLRVVYGQGRLLTLLKFLMMLFAYFISATMMFTITFLYTLYMQA